jgi:hypothetical protein
MYSIDWPPFSVRIVPTIVQSERLIETPDQLSVFSWPQKSQVPVLFIANIAFAAGSIVHDVYNLVGYSYFRLIDRIRLVIGGRGLSSAALKRIFEGNCTTERTMGPARSLRALGTPPGRPKRMSTLLPFLRPFAFPRPPASFLTGRSSAYPVE